MRVLIVEDEPIVAEDLAELAAAGGHEIVGVAGRASDARSLAPLRPDLALVDLHLKDGLTGAAIAADLVRTSGAVVVLVTANVDQIPPGFYGAIGALPKPFTAEAIIGLVAHVAGLRGAGAAAPPPPGFIAADSGPVWRMAAPRFDRAR